MRGHSSGIGIDGWDGITDNDVDTQGEVEGTDPTFIQGWED